MHLLLIFTLAIALAGCAMQSPIPQKLALQDIQTETSPAFVTRTRHSSIEVRTAKVANADSESWLLEFTIERLDGKPSEVKAAYALGALFPYIHLTADGAREEGYIPMSREIFEWLSQTGLEIALLDSDNRLNTVNVPAVVFTQAISP